VFAFKGKTHLIIKLQALWRGNLGRKQAELIRQAKRTDSRYFTMAEQRETLGNRIYDPMARREVRPPFRFQVSNAVYEGEWKGGFRDGHGK
jgi:hypothetical protein